MGTLTYPVHGAPALEFADRTLAHLQFVIGAKLRTRQGFLLSWTEQIEKGSGRCSIWIDSSIQLRFTYETAERHLLNRLWIEALMVSANSAGGLYLTSEPEAIARAA